MEVNKTVPLKPSDMELIENQREFPEFVVSAFNECIKRNWNGREAKIKQDEVISAMLKTRKVKRNQIFDNNYLDIEPLYESQSWRVEYDKPGYNENYEPFFVFQRKK